jgi:ABC-type iron transport system FetAB permease component
MDNEKENALAKQSDESSIDEESSLQRIFMLLEQSTLTSDDPLAIIASKLQPIHITQTISNADKKSDRKSKDFRFDRLFLAFVIVITLAFVLAFCVIFKDDKEMIKTVVIPLATLVMGGLGGYGLGYKKGLSSDD